jgi:quercetin dioxygenase-like cupin family protein
VKNLSQAMLMLSMLTCFATLCGTAMANTLIVTPGQLHWMEIAALPAGAQLAVIEGRLDQPGPITARLKLPARYRLPAHWHTSVQRVTVLSGTLNYGVGDRLSFNKTTALGQGSVLVTPAKVRSYGWTAQETVLQLNVIGPWSIVYVDPADDPRKQTRARLALN